MRENLRHKTHGISVRRFVSQALETARDEFESLTAIISNGIYGFELEGDELIEFVRLCIVELLHAGARPVVFSGVHDPMFWLADAYGTVPEEIADSIIAQWQAKGGGELEWGAYPFAFAGKGHAEQRAKEARKNGNIEGSLAPSRAIGP